MEEQSQISSDADAGAPARAAAAAKEPMPAETWALIAGVCGWLLPGLGHALQFMWGRALVVFLAVGMLVVAGASMRGNVFTRNGNDAFDKLGFIADLGTGTFYL